MERQVGASTEQMRTLAKNGVFVCDNARMWMYLKKLAVFLERPDIDVWTTGKLNNNCYRGRHFTDVAVDHSVKLTSREYSIIVNMRMRIR